MAYPIPDHDRAHFAAVQHALVADGLHLAMISADGKQLNAYAGALARALSQEHGWRVEAYRPSRLEGIVADLMLRRFDAALARISGPLPNQSNSSGNGGQGAGCVLFIPDAQTLPQAELAQLLRIAAGARMLRLVALFDGQFGHEIAVRVRSFGDGLAQWTLDETDEEHPLPHTGAAAAAAPPSRLRMAGMLAAAAVLLLALLPAAPWRIDRNAAPAAVVMPAHPTSISGSVQLAGDAPADFRHAAADSPPAVSADGEVQP